MSMPKLDGIEVLRCLRAEDVLRHIPVIMVMMAEDPEDVENCCGCGCSSYITKPVGYEKLLMALGSTGLI